MFVHIPKCAGTAVRRVLGRFDESGGAYETIVREHPEFGRLDYTHLPLSILQKVAPDDFEKLRNYLTVALVRDPEARFISALSQRLKMYGDQEIAQITGTEIDRLAREVVDALKDPKARHLPEFIHFAPQADYIIFEGAQLVDRIYLTTDIGSMIADIGHKVGEDLGTANQVNPTLVFRSDAVRRLATYGRRATIRLLGDAATRPVRQIARRVLMKPLKTGSNAIKLPEDTLEFVRGYYAEDFALFAKASGHALS